MKNDKVVDKSAAHTRETLEAEMNRKPGADKAIDLTDAQGTGEAALPHERDQTVGMTGGLPSKTVQQAHRDVERGLQDTSRAPEADKAYKKQSKSTR